MSPEMAVIHSALTFGTRNWTVRDMPPSHEAISIMKPANETGQRQLFNKILYFKCQSLMFSALTEFTFPHLALATFDLVCDFPE